MEYRGSAETVTCRICGWSEIHDPICDLHECVDCGAHGEHHCPAWCDVIDCPECVPADDNERRVEPPQPLADHNSADALKIEQRLADEDRCGWKRERR